MYKSKSMQEPSCLRDRHNLFLLLCSQIENKHICSDQILFSCLFYFYTDIAWKALNKTPSY